MNMGKMMITMKLMACFILVFLVFLVGCSSEKSEWEKAQSKNTIEAYETYLSKYPKGKFSMEALAKIEELVFTDAQQKNTIEAYETYLSKYPKGKFSTEALTKIEELAFTDAQQKNTIEAYETYLSKYPKGKFSMEALAKIEEFAFTDAQQKNTIEAYAEYLKKCPQGKAKLSGDLASVVEAYINAKERITISNKNVTEIQGISPIVGKGKVSFKKGKAINELKIEINGVVPVIGGKTCLIAMETIEIAPEVMIPTEFFTEKGCAKLQSYKVEKGTARKYFHIETITLDGKQYRVLKEPPVVERVELYSVLLSNIPIDTKVSEFIISGPKGATLKKVGKGFLLIDGEAYLLRTGM